MPAKPHIAAAHAVPTPPRPAAPARPAGSNAPARIAGLDILKTIAIFFVIAYHAGAGLYAAALMKDAPHAVISQLNYFATGLLATCIPIFFFVNGVLLFNRPLDIRRHIRKMVTLIALTVVWSVGTQVAFVAMGQWERLSARQIVHNVWQPVNQLNNHLWFLPALFVMYCFFPLMKSAFDQHRGWIEAFTVVAVLSTFVVVGVQMLIDVWQFLRYGNVGNQATVDIWNQFNPLRGIEGYSLVYFMLGGLLSSQRQPGHRRADQRSTEWIPALIVLIAAMIVYFGYNLTFAFSGQPGHDVVWGYSNPLVLIMTVSLYYMLRKVRLRTRIASWVFTLIGANTLGVYFIHWILIAAFRALNIDFIAMLGPGLWACCAEALVILAISCAMCWLMRRIPGVRRLVML